MTHINLRVFDEIMDHLSKKYQVYLQADNNDGNLLANELIQFKQDSAYLSDWELWCFIQNHCYEIMSRNTGRFTLEEIIFFGELPMHFRNGQPSWVIQTMALEQISATQICELIPSGKLVCENLPSTLWIEWPEKMSDNTPRWMSRVKGMLVSKMGLFELPLEVQKDYLKEFKKNSQSGDLFALMDALTELSTEGTPCTGYCIVAVKKDSTGLKFKPAFLGAEQDRSLKDMLECFRESTERDRKDKDLKQTIANLGIRILLWTASQNCFQEKSEMRFRTGAIIPELEQKSGKFSIIHDKVQLTEVPGQIPRPFVIEK